MKLRIKGNSLRLRMLRAEVAVLIREGVVKEEIRFPGDSSTALAYAIEHTFHCRNINVLYQGKEIRVVIPTQDAHRWAGGEAVGLYAELMIDSDARLSVAIEKDFACLDKSEAENEDTFPNPADLSCVKLA